MFLLLGSGSWYHKGWQRKTSSRIFYSFQWLEQKVILVLHSWGVFLFILSIMLRLQELMTCLWLNQLTFQQIIKCKIRIYFTFIQTWKNYYVVWYCIAVQYCLFVYFLHLIYGPLLGLNKNFQWIWKKKTVQDVHRFANPTIIVNFRGEWL